MLNGGSRLPRLGHNGSNTNTLSAPAVAEMAPREVDDEDYSGSREDSMDVESAVINGNAHHNGSTHAHRGGDVGRGEQEREWEEQGSGGYDEDMC